MTDTDKESWLDSPPDRAGAAPTGSNTSRYRRPVAGACSAVGGIALVVIGTAYLDDPVGVRIGLVLSGMAMLYVAVAVIGKLLVGPQFEADVALSSFWIGLIVVAAIFADVLPLAESENVSLTLRTPTLLRPDIWSGHPLGTDRQGLDMLGGIVYGARISLVVGLGAVIIGMLIGGVIGLAAAYYGGVFDRIARLITDSMLAFPALILLLAVVAVFGPSVRNVTLALALLGIPTYVRLSRANTLVFANREFVLAARAIGERNRTIMMRELLPNVALPVFSFGFVMIAVLIVAEASLSFLGLSVQRPTPTWGNMIAAGQADFERHPHLVFIPGVVLFLTVFSLNRLGDKARQIWAPRQVKT